MNKTVFSLLLLFTTAFSWQTMAQHYPIEATGYNMDVVANGVGTMASSTTGIVDSASYCYISEDWKLDAGDPDRTLGLPADGVITSPDISGLTYQIPSSATPYNGNNSLQIDNVGPTYSRDLTLTTPGKFQELYFLVASGSGDSSVDVTVNFSDSSTQSSNGLNVPDWFLTGLPVEISGVGRGNVDNNNIENPAGNPKLFRLRVVIDLANQLKNVESVTFTKTDITTGDSVLNVMAISGKSYCIPTTTGDSGHIANFLAVGDAGQDISNIGSGPGINNGYSDFTDQSVEGSENGTIAYTVALGGLDTAGVKIWVDWNNNQVFDAGEIVYESSTLENSFTGSFTIPAATLGNYRMRIGSSNTSATGPANACASSEEGEYEDYTIVITPEPCSGTPDAGTATVNPTSGTPGSSYTVSAEDYSITTGLSFQWQSNTNTLGWEDEGTPTAMYAPYNATAPSQAGDEVEWRLAVTCNASGQTGFSTVATFLTTAVSYCAPPLFSNTIEPITRVLFAGIDNTTPAATGGDPYEDFTAIVGEVEAGETYTFAAEGNTDGNFTNYFTAWIDWNQDGIFQNPTEMFEIGSVTNSNGTDGQQATNDIEVPFTALSGPTRMRVVKNYNASPTDPCDTATYGYGQTEDYTVNITKHYVYDNGWIAPLGDPSGVSTLSDNVSVLAGTTGLTANTNVNNLLIEPGATLNISKVLNLHGNITNNGDLVFLSNATGNGELGKVPGTSTISGTATVQRYMQNKRSYRMVSSAVSTTTSIHANWQENANSNTHNPAPGFGTHITGTNIDQENGFDATSTGNPSMYTVNVATQQFEIIDNTDVNTLTAGNAYLMMIRGDRTIDLSDNEAFGETTLRATGELAVGDAAQTFTAPTMPVDETAFVMFGNPYQSTVDMGAVFAASTNVNTNNYYVFDPSLGDYGAYVTVNPNDGSSNIPSSDANQYLQPGQGAQVAASGAGQVIVNFQEDYKSPGQFTSTNATGNTMVADGRLIGELSTQENFNNGGPVHDGFVLLFSDDNNNDLTPEDAVKPMNFYENLGIDHDGTYLSVERREMPQPEEVYPLYSNGYNYSDYILKLTVDGLDTTFLYLDDNFTGTTTLLEAGENTYSFSVDASDPLSKATDRFSIRTEQRLGVNDDNLLAGIRLYPNPLNGNTLYINAPKLNGEQLSVSIFDLTGRSIYEQTLECRANTITVPMGSDVASGVYLVTLKHGGEANTYRLIKK